MRSNISYVGSISFYTKCSNFSRAARGEVEQRKYGISTCQWLFAHDMNRGEERLPRQRTANGSHKPLTWQGVNQSTEIGAEPAASCKRNCLLLRVPEPLSSFISSKLGSGDPTQEGD
jgi:hypothetical protein